jgi:ankyrin repeat protein
MRSLRPLFAIAALLVFSAARIASAQDAQSKLWDAAIAGDTAAIRQAVKDGARVDSLDTRTNRNGRYALNWATWNNRADAVKLLLELKAPLNAANLTGFTALHHAAENGSVDAARILLAAGADVTLTNKSGYTASLIAQERGHPSVAALIEAAAKKVK